LTQNGVGSPKASTDCTDCADGVAAIRGKKSGMDPATAPAYAGASARLAQDNALFGHFARIAT